MLILISLKAVFRRKTWRGAACSAWRRPRRLWEPQATPLQGQSGQSGFFSGIKYRVSINARRDRSNIDFVGKLFCDEKLGGALLAAPGGVREASGSRKRLPSRANPASPGFSAESNIVFPCC